VAKKDTSVSIAGLTFKNPVMTASGTCGYGLELTPYFELSRLGALVVKGLSVKPRSGNPPPRIIETCGGMLNAIGLENVGMEAFVTDSLPKLREHDVPLIVNILGDTKEEYGLLAEYLSRQQGIDALEINVSCPNVQKGGIAFGANAESLEELICYIRNKTDKPLFVKLSPNVTDIGEMAEKAEKAGADALTLINTLRGMAVDIHSRKPRLANVVGGLSGPAIKPVALAMVWEAARRVSIPIIGAGGILTAGDAVEFILCGATAVQVGTAHFRNPAVCVEIIEGLEAYLDQYQFTSIKEIVKAIQS